MATIRVIREYKGQVNSCHVALYRIINNLLSQASHLLLIAYSVRVLATYHHEEHLRCHFGPVRRSFVCLALHNPCQ